MSTNSVPRPYGPLPDGWSEERWQRVCAYDDAMYRRDFAPLIERRPGWSVLAAELIIETRRVAYAQTQGRIDANR